MHPYQEQFPILAECTYLASHSLGAVPRATESALAEYYQHWARAGILAWEGPWWQEMVNFCAALERLLGAAPDTVVPTLNVTGGMATVASCLDYSGPRRRVVLSDLEFTTTYPFWRNQERLGAELTLVSSPDGIGLDPQQLLQAVDERTLLVVSSHAYFRSGALQDLEVVGRHCREQGAWFLVDCYQSFGCVPFQVSSLSVDFVVGGCHKWLLGGPGGGFLYVRPELIAHLEPRFTGWFGLADPFAYAPGVGSGERHAGVRRLLNGTPNVVGFYAAREGLAAIEAVGLDRIRSHSLQVTGQLIEGARARGFEVRTPTDRRRNGMVCLNFAGAREAQAHLQAHKVVVDWRPDCGLRVSPHFYNTSADIEEFFAQLDRF